MPSPSLVDTLRAQSRRKPVRYAAVSGIAMTCNIVVLFVALWALKVRADADDLSRGVVMANVIAVSMSSIPSYVLNRYWVWGKRGRNKLWTEVAPFWAMAVLGLVLSTLFVYIAHQYTSSKVLLVAANLSAFGILWVGKYLALDALLFKVAPHEVQEEIIDAVAAERELDMAEDGLDVSAVS
jgi:putative flippase GtrA